MTNPEAEQLKMWYTPEEVQEEVDKAIRKEIKALKLDLQIEALEIILFQVSGELNSLITDLKSQRS